MPSTIVAPPENSPASKSDERAGKYLTLQLGKEEFGVGVMKVREIMRFTCFYCIAREV